MGTAKYQRGHKMYLDKEETIESAANIYFECRDGVIESFEYVNYGGNNPYGWTRLMLCWNHKHEVCGIIRQEKNMDGSLREEVLNFDTDSFKFLEALIKGEENVLGGKFELLRDY